ncbi:MAG: PKD domain-containing protein [Ekhidna sp.]|uniref:hypothetical protein n=1 Tax=Ekhidna sp. TaxID=2608089 RepID=UPI0032EFE343
MKKILTLITVLITFSISAQVMPSPDAASMIKGINTPVSLYNGTMSVSLPLYEAKANNGAVVPVALQYNGGGGIRVAEVAGVAGLGWHLQAGGSITRVVQDQPDEHAKFTTNINYETVSSVAHGRREFDFQKDLFFFSFPGGGGKFIFTADDLFQKGGGSFRRECEEACSNIDFECHNNCDDTYGTLEHDFIAPNDYTSNEIATLPSSDVQIEFNYRDKLDSDFVITDMQGTKYYFGQTSDSRERTINNFKDNFSNTEYENKNKREFISTWHLTKIEFINLPANDAITFSYENATITTETDVTKVPARTDLNLYAECMATKSAGENCDDCMEFNKEVDNPYNAFTEPDEYAQYKAHNSYYRNNITTQKSVIYTKLVSRINFSKGSIRFGYEARSDLDNGKKLSVVSLYDHKNKEVSSSTLSQNYFSSTDSYFKGGTRGYSSKGRRLKLEAVITDGMPIATFDYINDKQFHPGGQIDMYELPPRDSYYTDHWGYYNGGPHQGETYTWHGSATVNGTTIRGMKKGIKNYAKANILTKVTYAAGGYKEFMYETHDHHGGVRIDKIKTVDKDGQVVSDVHYTYEEEYIPDDLSYVENHVVTVPQDRDEITGKIIPHIFESSQTFVFDLNGPSNGYRKVIEKNNITGEESIHEFIRTGDEGRGIDYASKTFAVVDVYRDNFNHYPGRPVYNSGFPPTIDHYDPIDKLAFPFSTPSVMYFDRGLEKKVTHKDKNGVVIGEVENYYEHIFGNDFTIFNHGFHLEYLDEDVGTFQDNSLIYNFIVSKYKVSARYLRLNHSITRSFDDMGNLVFETKSRNYYHNTYKSLVKETSSERIDGFDVENFPSKTKIFYPQDVDAIRSFYGTSTILNEMVDHHIIGLPVATTTEVDLPNDHRGYWVNGSNHTIFQKVNGMFLPHKAVNYLIDGAEVEWYDEFQSEITQTLTYNNQGLLASQTGQDGITTSYTYDDAGYIKTVTTDPGVASLKRTTTYEHFPLIGLKSVTGTDGRKVSYEYDDQNRLLLTRDHEGNILKRYRYNYAGESTSFSVYMTPDGGYNQTCSPIKFVVNGTSDLYGETKFTWDFGDQNVTAECGATPIGPMGEPIVIDGTDGNASVVETRNNYVYHNFKEAGTYTVKVSAFNPELGEEKTYSREITIYDLKAGAVVNGPSSVEYCTSTGGGGGGVEQQNNTPMIPQMDGDVAQMDGGSSGSNYPNAYFSVGFSSGGARCQDYGVSSGQLQYKLPGGSWIPFGENGFGSLPGAAFFHSSSPYNVEIKGQVSDNCSSGLQSTSTHIMKVNPCGYSSGGTGGIGTGGTGGGIGNPDTPTLPDDEQQ